MPGFGVIQQGGRGALTSLFPRGGESDYTLVIADGIPLNAFGGCFDAAHLSARQSSASKWCAGRRARCTAAARLAASCSVVTPHGGRAAARMRSSNSAGYGTAQTGAVTSGARGAWSWGATFDWLDTDGDTSQCAEPWRAVANDDYDRFAGNASVTWSDRADRRVRVDVAAAITTNAASPVRIGSDPLGLYGGLDLVSRGHEQFTGVARLGDVRAPPELPTRVAVHADRRARRVPERRLLRSVGD